MIEFRQKEYSMGVTKALFRLGKVENKIGRGINNAVADVVSGLYQNANHPKAVRFRAKARALGNPIKLKRKTITRQNKLINVAAKGKSAMKNPGAAFSDVVEVIVRNPGYALATAGKYTAAGVTGNPALVVAPVGVPAAALDQAVQKFVPGWKRATNWAGDSVLKNRDKTASVINGALRSLSVV